MKNKLEISSASEQFTDNLAGSFVDRRKSSTPRIVVFPPMEDRHNSVPTTLHERPSRQRSRVPRDDNSLKSSSSNDSVTGEGRSDDNTCSISDSSSEGSEKHRRHKSTISLRRLFANLNLSIRSHSSSPVEHSRKSKKNQQPKRLLRSPVTYTYVRGLSGLPTQRVPRHVAYQYVT